MNVWKMIACVLHFNNIMNLLIAILFALLTVLQAPLALGASPQINPPAPFPEVPDENHSFAKDDNPHQTRHKFKQYVKDKYKQIDDAESYVKQTQHGLSGHMTISGDIVPLKGAKTDLTKEKDRHDRARAIAMAFMDDEHIMLGITSLDDLIEFNINTDLGFGGDYTHINYHRLVNGIKLGGAGIHIVIGPEEKIKHVSADLEPVPPEVYEATKKKAISEEEVRSIVEADLEKEQIQGYKGNNIVKIYKKLAITKQPYVIWDVFYYYLYKIDAFTGEILSKTDPIRKEYIPPAKDLQGVIEPPMPPPVLPQK